ncbi:MAG TPA: DNA alkylation repair protein [Candidatus Paceibacterota bacterium]|nr:DNA alkylation repair protein [Candidatus Pacearchaeota archaeon]HRR94670.1 DNA alkylation repair protein [Candidatus Paceibacterota bacterium]HRU20828.1 DNA alkylation repair protein [Candidatus Paceibacterota bacterium]
MVNLNNKISILVDKELRKLSDKEFARSRNRLIGKSVISYGVKTQEIRKITKEYFKRFQKETQESWLKVVKELMSTKVFEDQMAGIFLLSKIGGKLSISELEKLIKKYIDNWATCDTMSSEVVAKILIRSPERIEALYTWAKSKNIWLKRAALITTVKFKDKIENWQEIACQILSLLEKEKEPTIKKAAHWLKKEVLR